MAEEDDDIANSLSSSLNLTKELKSTTDALGKSISTAFARGVVDGKRFEDVLRSIGQRMITFGLRAAFKPLEGALQSALGSILSGATSTVTPSANGNVFLQGRVTPFAAGGVVAQPTYFPAQDGWGLMGERGAEAVMPLARGADGRLGVRAANSAPASITVNIAAQDVESFRRSEAQIVGALSRAVARGRRAV